jgi:hypothetical protein
MTHYFAKRGRNNFSAVRFHELVVCDAHPSTAMLAIVSRRLCRQRGDARALEKASETIVIALFSQRCSRFALIAGGTLPGMVAQPVRVAGTACRTATSGLQGMPADPFRDFVELVSSATRTQFVTDH